MSESGSRLLQLLAILASRPWSTASELAERLEVSGRTVRRDIRNLRELGYPVESFAGPGGGYGFGRGGRLPPLMLDDDEAVAIAVGLRLVSAASMAGGTEAAARASAKLEQLLSGSLSARVDAVAEATVLLDRDREQVGVATLTTLTDAAHAGHGLRLSYRDRSGHVTDRHVAPHRVVHARGRWYLVAHDEGRSDWRTFRLDRIESAARTGRTVELVDPPDAAEYVSRSVSTSPYRHAARVEVAAPAAELAQRIPPTVGMVEARGEGSLLTVGGDDLDGMVGHLVMLGLPFVVLEPPELVARVEEIARRLETATLPGTGGR